MTVTYTLVVGHPGRTMEPMAEVVQHSERFGDTVRDLPAPTGDDTTILRDGRRLDTAEKVRAFVAELRSEQPAAGGELDR